jgi:hypothetical protein
VRQEIKRRLEIGIRLQVWIQVRYLVAGVTGVASIRAGAGVATIVMSSSSMVVIASCAM